MSKAGGNEKQYTYSDYSRTDYYGSGAWGRIIHIFSTTLIYHLGNEVKQMSDKLYDFLRDIADLILPAFGVLYLALAELWGFPYGDKVNNTIICVVAFLDVVLKVLKNRYNKKLIEEEGEDNGI